MSPDLADRFLELARTRRSVRQFSSEPVGPELERRLLEAARWAPSAGNAQPWIFLRVRSSELKGKLAEAARGQRFVAQAPLVVVVCVDRRRAEQAYGQRGLELYSLQDTAAATQNLLLAAHAHGLGACWVGAFREADVVAALALPAHHRPVAIIPIGVPAGRPSGPGRRELADVAPVVE
jgi:nitroreductase